MNINMEHTLTNDSLLENPISTLELTDEDLATVDGACLGGFGGYGRGFGDYGCEGGFGGYGFGGGYGYGGGFGGYGFGGGIGLGLGLGFGGFGFGRGC